MTRILVLGASGSVGRVVVRELLETSDAEVVAADIRAPAPDDLDTARAARVTPLALDVTDADALRKAVAASTIVANATAMRFAMPVIRAAIDECVHLVDLGSYRDTIAQLALSEEAASAKVCAVIGAGVAPGLTNVLARYGAAQLDTIDRIQIHSFLVNALFESPANVIDRFDAGHLSGLVVRDGTLIETTPLAEPEAVDFGSPEGRQIVHLMPHPETLTLSRSLMVANVEFKTGYPPAEDAILEAFRTTALDSTDPVRIGETQIVPRDFVAAVVGTRRRGSMTTANLKRVSIEGTKGGESIRLLYTTTVRAEGGSATSQITGTMAAIATLEVLARGIPGVHSAESGLDPSAVLQALARRGYRVAETRTATRSSVGD